MGLPICVHNCKADQIGDEFVAALQRASDIARNNEPLPIATVRVRNPDRSPLGINR